MAEELSLAKGHTALLVMDYQNDIVKGFANAELVDHAARVIAAARQAGLPVVYVKVAFRPGHPEVSPLNRAFSGIKAGGMFAEDQPGTTIHPGVAPQPGDVVVSKRRFSAFAGSDLAVVLSGLQTTTLVMMGISTSGVILSTVCQAADLDYDVVVLKDCCAEKDPEVHRVLLEKVLVRRATVVESGAFLAALSQAQ